MKAFACLSLLSLAAAAPAGPVLLAHHAPVHHAVVGGQTSHQSVSRPGQEVRTLTQSKAFGATHSSVAQADNSKGLAEIQPSVFANRPVAQGKAAVVPLHSVAPQHVAHAVHAAPVVHAAPAYHAPVKAGYVADDLAEQSPYQFTYAVADDYSKSSFNAEETSDGASNVAGSYSVALPDGRIQHVKYTSNGYDGFVADVTYEGTAVYPEEPVYKAAPAPAYHA